MVMKKKTGIVTLHFSINYGAVLQCMALQNYLKSKGNDTEVIDYVPDYLEEYWNPWISPTKECRNRLIYCGKNPLKTSLIMMKTFFETLSKNSDYFYKKRKFDRFKHFISKYINVSAEHFSDAVSIGKRASEYGIIFTGSDQVWNPSFTKGNIDDVYLLKFGNGEFIKAAYAASAGISGDDFIKQLSEDISNIEYISVREKSLADSLNKSDTGLNVERVIDPTLLFSGDEWRKYENTDTAHNYKYILVYCLKQHDEFAEVMRLLKENADYKVIDISPEQVRNEKNDSINKSDCGPDEFLSFIDRAEFVITNSFHATIFSILFEKKFLTIPDDTTGSRMIDLLNDFNLTGRIYDKKRGFDDYMSDVEYSEARAIREKLKADADSFFAKVGAINEN